MRHKDKQTVFLGLIQLENIRTNRTFVHKFLIGQTRLGICRLSIYI